MKKIFINNIGDLIEIQRSSFYKFLLRGITEEMILFKNPFISNLKIINKKLHTVLVYLYPTKIKFTGPKTNILKCIEKNLNYTFKIYITCEYYYPIFNLKSKKLKSINFFDKQFFKLFSKDRKQILIKEDFFICEIPLLTDEGTFIINGCERIIISQIIRSPGIYFTKQFSPITLKTNYIATLISKNGLWTKFILNTDKKHNDVIYINFTDLKNKLKNLKIYFSDLLKYFNLNSTEILDFFTNKNKLYIFKHLKLKTQFISNKYYIEKFYKNFKDYFFVGQFGRYKLNKALNLNFPNTIEFLTGHDLLKIINNLFNLKYSTGIIDNIDDIKNKYIRSIGELLQIQFHIGLNLLENLIETKIKNLQIQLKFKKLQKFQKTFINSLVLTKIIHDFFITSQLSQFMDQINPLAELTHKRRISVLGPNGLKRDNINTNVRDIHPSQYGRLCPIETPEGQNAGLINALALYGRVNSFGELETPYFYKNNNNIYFNKSPIFLNSEQENNNNIAFNTFNINKNQNYITQHIYSKKHNLISLKNLNNINFLTISPFQIISIATALIPFVEHDDSNRALMGSNMQRQAVSLLYTQPPIVGTGLELHVINNSGMVLKSYSEGIVNFSSSFVIKIKDLTNQTINYYLQKYNKSNQNTAINQYPIVWPGEYIFAGQILCDGPSTANGELALGKNLLIAYMPWEGYNYEDAIIINEKLLINNVLTSVHIEECETYILPSEILTKNLPIFSSDILSKLDQEGIIKLGSYVEKNDVLISKARIYNTNNEFISDEKLIIFTLNKKNKKYIDTSLYVPANIKGRIIDIRIELKNLIYKQKKILCNKVRIYIAQIKKLQIGDKLAGRHGNKGIITRILPNEDMPYLPNGNTIDIIFNPLGVPSRMNVGQIFECLLGLAGYYLGTNFKILPFDELYGNEASRILINNKLKEATIKTNLNWIFNSYYPGKVLLKDGRTGEYFDNPITIGKSYILKLIHLVSDKLQARAIGPYASITEQPVAGKSQKGGQRFGEMEIWALEAYGCSNTLQEFLTIKSDDIDGREQIYNNLSNTKNNILDSVSLIPEAFLTLIRELNSLGLDFTLYNFKSTTQYPINLIKNENTIFTELETRLKLKILEKNI